MKIILDELNPKEFFSNGGVVKIVLDKELTTDRCKLTFFDYLSYVRYMRSVYLKYINEHNDISKSEAYEKVNSLMKITSYIGDKHYTLDPTYDNNKSLEMCYFYYCGDNDTYEFNNNKDPYGIKNVNFSNIDETDPNWDHYAVQRLDRGFDSSELWSLDSTIVRFILPRLKAFILEKNSFEFKSNKRLNNDIDDIIKGFELIADDKEKTKEEEKIIERSLDIFRDNFRQLWF